MCSDSTIFPFCVINILVGRQLRALPKCDLKSHFGREMRFEIAFCVRVFTVQVARNVQLERKSQVQSPLFWVSIRFSSLMDDFLWAGTTRWWSTLSLLNWEAISSQWKLISLQDQYSVLKRLVSVKNRYLFCRKKMCCTKRNILFLLKQLQEIYKLTVHVYLLQHSSMNKYVWPKLFGIRLGLNPGPLGLQHTIVPVCQ